MNDTLYKFLPREFAYRVLEDKRLKVSTLIELNDIYDFSIPRPQPESGTNALSGVNTDGVIKQIRDTYGILCFSRGYESPALWGHYAEGAKGLALGFDPARLHWEHRVDLSYSDSRPVITPRGTSKAEIERSVLWQLSSQKAEEWGYEKEVRDIVSLDRCEPAGGLYFSRYHPIALREVIAGPRFDDFSYLRRFVAEQFDTPVTLLKAVEHPTKYIIATE